MAKLSIIFVSSCLLLTACAEPSVQNLCKDYGEARPCTKAELVMIDDMRTIINAVRNYEYSEPNSARWVGRRPKNNVKPTVLFFGEMHPEIIGRMQTLGAINYELRKGDILLLEGNDRRAPLLDDCGISLVFDLYKQWQFEKLGREYLESFRWKFERNFSDMLKITRESYDLSGLNLADAKCGFWDDGEAVMACLKDSSKIDDYLPTRNAAMVEAIKERRKSFARVIINTGYAHMPYMDYLEAITEYKLNRLPVPTKRSEYYRFIEAEKLKNSVARGGVKLENRYGSTRVIYDYLKAENIPYSEQVHGKMLR